MWFQFESENVNTCSVGYEALPGESFKFRFGDFPVLLSETLHSIAIEHSEKTARCPLKAGDACVPSHPLQRPTEKEAEKVNLSG